MNMYPTLETQTLDGIARLNAVITEARRLSMAASELKLIEDAHLEPDALSDAWEHAYSELYRANEAFKAALEKAFPKTAVAQEILVSLAKLQQEATDDHATD